MSNKLLMLTFKGNAPLSAAEFSRLKFDSVGERTTACELVQLPGIRQIDAHPRLPGSDRLAADFKVAALSETVYVEVAMLAADPKTDRNDHHRKYRARLAAKVSIYRLLKLGEPVIIWSDELKPLALARKMAEILRRLGLPPRSLQQPSKGRMKG